jgi:hypothetical protein
VLSKSTGTILSVWDRYKMKFMVLCKADTRRARLFMGVCFEFYRGILTWRVLGLQMEDMACRYGGQLRIYWKQLRSADKGWSSSSLGVGWGLTTPHCRKPACYETLMQDLSGCLWTGQWTFAFSKRRGISWLAEWLSASEKRTLLVELV